MAYSGCGSSSATSSIRRRSEWPHSERRQCGHAAPHWPSQNRAARSENMRDGAGIVPKRHTMRRYSPSRPLRGARTTTWLAWGLALFVVGWTSLGSCQEAIVAPIEVPARAYLIPVPLPLTGDADLRVKEAIESALARQPGGQRAGLGRKRPTLVLEFADADRAPASQFERALALARFLAGDTLHGVRTVAYLKESISGHAVLVALACEQIIAGPDIEMGDADAGDRSLDVTVRSGYREIASRRRTIPVAVALAMLDATQSLYRVQTPTGVQFVLDEQRDALQAEGKLLESATLCDASRTARFTARELRLEHGFVSHLAASRVELAASLGLAAQQIEVLGQAISKHPLLIDVGEVDRASLRRVERMIEQERKRRPIDLVCLRIDSVGGHLVDTVDFVRYLTTLTETEVQTVAYVEREALADSALIALFCDRCYATAEARLAGPPSTPYSEGEIALARDVLRTMAQERHQRWSLPIAIVDPSVTLHHWQQQETGAKEILSDDEQNELRDSDHWDRGDPFLTGSEVLSARGDGAVQLGIVDQTVTDWSELLAIHAWENDPATPRVNWADDLILALASPDLSRLLIVIAMVAMMAELSAPGIGIAGFISASCFMLFFWSNYLNGTAGWLEVLLFVLGLLFVLVEVFVIPGFGLFGIGGSAMVLLSLVLASQTFVIPRNLYEMEQLPGSLWTAATALLTLIVAMAVMHKYLDRLPILGRMVLKVRPHEEAIDEGPTELEELIGARGVTVSRLAPYGKARFGTRWIDVTSEGQLVESGHPVRVVAVAQNRVTVRPVADSI